LLLKWVTSRGLGTALQLGAIITPVVSHTEIDNKWIWVYNTYRQLSYGVTKWLLVMLSRAWTSMELTIAT
jgi:hypothetical protein